MTKQIKVNPGTGVECKIDTFEKCPDRVIDEYNVADCIHPDSDEPHYICSYSREQKICPRGLP
jgi:hypothetical protein